MKQDKTIFLQTTSRRLYWELTSIIFVVSIQIIQWWWYWCTM